MYAAIVGSAALAVVGTIFVVTMRRNVGASERARDPDPRSRLRR
jgi:hypothetical protein